MAPPVAEIPEVVESARLVLRAMRLHDAAEINAAIYESISELRPWMPWARDLPTLADTVKFCREAQAKFEARTVLALQIRAKADDRLVGMTGLHDIDWADPRMEIGYWLRTGCTGQGYAVEAVECLTRFAFESLRANRVAITMDDLNQRSWRVAERAGFRLEGILRNEQCGPSGRLRDTRIYAKIRRVDGVVE